MQTHAKVKDDSTILRDLKTGALVAQPTELELYRKKKAGVMRDRDRDNKLNKLENDVKDIKELLNSMMELMKSAK